MAVYPACSGLISAVPVLAPATPEPASTTAATAAEMTAAASSRLEIPSMETSGGSQGGNCPARAPRVTDRPAYLKAH